MATDNVTSLFAIPKDRALACGVVRTVHDDGLLVAHDGGATIARRAVSCLLAPQVGDNVLLAFVADGIFVLAVLEREGDEREIDVAGGLRISADDLTLSSRNTTRVLGDTLMLAAREATWVGETLRMLGDKLTLDATRLEQVTTFTEIVAESVKETLGRSYRDVRESEHVKAGAMTFSIRHMMRVHADTAVVTAKKLVKLGGEQIHIG